MNKLHPKTVGDYVTLQRGTTYNGNLVGEPGPALLGLGSIEPGGGFRSDKYKTFGGECPEKIMLSPGDLYVALKGATKDGSMVGSIARLPETIPSGRLTQDTARLDFINKDPEIIKHLYWVLRTPQYRQYCASRLTGSAAASFSREDFLSYPVPPISSTSKTLTDIFEAIESKIEINRRMNVTLEAMAQALFKSWFVDFDPVKVKAEGRAPEGMDANTATLFPSEFQDSGLGPIPKGWRESIIGNEVRVLGGGTPSTKEPAFWDGGTYNWVTPRDLAQLTDKVLLDTERKITEEGVKQISSGQLPIGTVLLSSRAPIGYLSITQIPVSVNQGFIAMICNKQLSPYFVLHWAEHSMETIKLRSSGTTFAEISKANFRPIPVIVPSEEIIKQFSLHIAPLYEQIVNNARQNTFLTQIRNELLPRLISGQIRLA